MTVNMKEKMELAKELGLMEWYNKHQRQIDMANEIAAMTELKFKPITVDQIREKLKNRYWDFNIMWPIPINVKAKIQTMPLRHWQDNIPVGALHAVKEAKSKGLGNFQIYFPVTLAKDRIMKDPIITGQLVLSLGRAGNTYLEDGPTVGDVLYEVHSWDDGKVYD